VDRYPFFPGDQVVGVRDDLLFHCTGHAVAGRKSQNRAFVRGKAGPGMTFYDPGNLFTKTHRTYEISPTLRMADIMGPAPADIVENRTQFHEMKIDFRVMCCIPTGTVPYCPAVGDYLCAAPGITQQILACFFLFFRHGQATS